MLTFCKLKTANSRASAWRRETASSRRSPTLKHLQRLSWRALCSSGCTANAYHTLTSFSHLPHFSFPHFFPEREAAKQYLLFWHSDHWAASICSLNSTTRVSLSLALFSGLSAVNMPTQNPSSRDCHAPPTATGPTEPDEWTQHALLDDALP